MAPSSVNPPKIDQKFITRMLSYARQWHWDVDLQRDASMRNHERNNRDPFLRRRHADGIAPCMIATPKLRWRDSVSARAPYTLRLFDTLAEVKREDWDAVVSAR